MFDETIKKYTANKRTGANLTSIRLGATPNLTNNIAVATMKELEEFGKRIDKSRIDRETQRLYIEGKKRDLEFERTLSDPQIYLNDELYDKKVKELEELKKAKNMDIASSKYLDIETKRSLMQSLEVENEKILNDMTAKRTVNLFKREVSALNDEMEQLIIIGGDLPAYDIEGKKEIVGKLQNSNQRYRELTGLSAMEGAMILGQGIMNMEQRGLDNLLTDIINSNFDTSVKKEKIEGILTEINDEKKLDQLASNYNTYLPKGLSKENQEQMKLFYKATIKNVYREVGEKANRYLKSYENEIRIDQERVRQAEIERTNKVNKAFNSGSYWDMLEAKSEIIPKYTDILTAETQAINLKNPALSPAYEMYGKTLKELNQSGMYIKDFLPQNTINNLNEQINKRIDDLGQTRFEATYEVLSAITKELPQDVAEALVNSFAVKNGEYQQNEYKIMLKGIKNPTDSEFSKVKNFNTVLERGGDISNTDLKIAMQVPIIAQMANKVVDKSGGRITPIVATKTVMKLYLGINSSTNAVPIGEPKSEEDYAEYLVHIFTDGNSKIKSELNKKLGDDEEIINTIINLKQDRKILYPAIMKGGY